MSSDPPRGTSHGAQGDADGHEDYPVEGNGLRGVDYGEAGSEEEAAEAVEGDRPDELEEEEEDEDPEHLDDWAPVERDDATESHSSPEHASRQGSEAPESDEDYSDVDDEGQDGYREGGYHPVSIGDVFVDRYRVRKKLGWGHFSTVWMVDDLQHPPQYRRPFQEGPALERPKLLALKVQKSAEHYMEAAMDEIDLLTCIKDRSEEERPDFDSHVVRLEASFEHEGPNGRHICMVFEMLGANLLSLIKRYDYQGIPIPTVRRITKQICKGLMFLHEKCRIIHTDLKPENILVSPATEDVLQVREKAVEAAFKARSVTKGLSPEEGQSLPLPPPPIASGTSSTAPLSASSPVSPGMTPGSSDAAVASASTIEEIMAVLGNAEALGLTSDERKKLKRKLKKKKQKQKLKDKEAAAGGASGESSTVSSQPDAARDGLPASRCGGLGGEFCLPTGQTLRLAASTWVEANWRCPQPADPGTPGPSVEEHVANCQLSATLLAEDSDWDPDHLLDCRLALVAPAQRVLALASSLDRTATEATPESAMALPAALRSWSFEVLEGPDLRPGGQKRPRGAVARFVLQGHGFEDRNSSTTAAVSSCLRPADVNGDSAPPSAAPADDAGQPALPPPPGVAGAVALPVPPPPPPPSAEPACVWTIYFSRDHTALVLAAIEAHLPGVAFLVYSHPSEFAGGPPPPSGVDASTWGALHSAMTAGCCHILKAGGHVSCRGIDLSMLPWCVPGAGAAGGSPSPATAGTVAGTSADGAGGNARGSVDGGEEVKTPTKKEGPRSLELRPMLDRLALFLGRIAPPDAAGVGTGAVVQHGLGKETIVPPEEEEVDGNGSTMPARSSSPEGATSSAQEAQEPEVVAPRPEDAAACEHHPPAVGTADETAAAATAAAEPFEFDAELAVIADDAMATLSTTGVLQDDEALARSRIVVVDLGNACWTTKHFSDDIQTRQYRCPEVILGADYDTSADMWSLGCIVFELLTGDLLFDPRAGEDYDRDEDHLAQCIELLGDVPKVVATTGKHVRKYFNKKNELRNISNLRFWPLAEVLEEKYHFEQKDAVQIADFLNPLFRFIPSKRATARDCLDAPWLQGLD
uniref:non-specific serine/threonine protein kinase n=1 Tax=Rhizochromulina marina TaxID=1034831 RepID=A0A7S2RKS9_9STRA